MGYNNVGWFVDEVIKLETKMAIYFEITTKDISMTEGDDEHYRSKKIRRVCDKGYLFDQVRDHCHLTCKYRKPAHINCNINVTQNQNTQKPFVFHKFSNYDCHLFIKKVVDRKNDKAKFDIIPRTNEENISVTYILIRPIDSNRFLSSSLGSLVKAFVDNSHKTLKNLKEEIVDNDEILDIVNEITEDDKTIKNFKKDYPDKVRNLEEALVKYMGENDLKILKTEFPDKWNCLTKKLAYSYEYFNSIDDHQ